MYESHPELIKVMMGMGVMANINQTLDLDTFQVQDRSSP